MTKFFTVAALLLIIPAMGEVLWPQFRGPNGDGTADASNIPTTFGPTENLKWRTPIPGKGWSSPVVADQSIWITSAIEVMATPEETEKLLTTENGEKLKNFKSLQVAKKIRLILIELDLATGTIKREIELAVSDEPDAIHSLNSYSSPTPFLEEGRIYAHFGTFGTFCVDTTTGKTLWKTQLPLDHGVGPGSSPFVFGNNLVLICDGVDQQYVTALDKTTGGEVWKTSRPPMRAPVGDQQKAYSTPIVVTPKDGEPQIVCLGAQWLVSYEPSTGKEIWRLDHGDGFSVVPRPVFSEKEELIYISTGYQSPQLWAIRADGNGDITSSDKVVWKETKRIPTRPSPLLVGDEIFVITDGGIGSCLDAATGKLHWTERIGGNYSSSPLLAAGKIYLCNQEGIVTVLNPGKTYEALATNNLNNEQIMASPVALTGQLLIRSGEAVYCFSK